MTAPLRRNIRLVVLYLLRFCRWISVLNNAKEQVLMKAFGDTTTNSQSSAYNQSLKELTRTILQQVRRLPGNQTCCDCGAPGNPVSLSFFGGFSRCCDSSFGLIFGAGLLCFPAPVTIFTYVFLQFSPAPWRHGSMVRTSVFG